MRKALALAVALAGTAALSSCNTSMRVMREPVIRTELARNDWTLSEQVTGSASSTKILSIDFQRLFTSTTSGTIENPAAMTLPSLTALPVIGGVVGDRTASYALYDLMQKNPGYDVVMYPQYETRVNKPLLGLGFIYRKTEVTATARLGKLK